MKKLFVLLLALACVGLVFAEDAPAAMSLTMYGEPTATLVDQDSNTGFYRYFETYVNWKAGDMAFSATSINDGAQDFFKEPRNWSLSYTFLDGKVKLLGGDLRETGGVRLTTAIEGNGFSTRVANADKLGVMVTAAPIENLAIAAFVPMTVDNTETGGALSDQFKAANFGVAYTLTDIAKIVAGYRQANKELWVGADVKAIKDLTLALGFKSVDGDSTIYATAGYTVSGVALALDAHVDLLDTMTYEAEVQAEYGMAPFAIGANVSYGNYTTGWFETDGIIINPYVRQDFSKGNVNVGFSYNTGDSSWSVPLQFVISL